MDYQPYQMQLACYQQLSEARCRAAIQWLPPDGQVQQGAAAAFLALNAGGRPACWCAYQWLPGFARASEALYRWVAAHRSLVFTLLRWLLGARLQPVRYDALRALFVRLLALVYLLAFVSCALQMPGLYGEQGIIPLAQALPAAEQRWWSLPTLFWISQADSFLLALPMAGALVALLLLLTGRWPMICLTLSWLAYLSLVNAGPVFMQYQWDLLLPEAGLLALVLQQWPVLGVWLYRWLLFRFVWLSGWVKLASGDPLWADWRALTVHFETQPLPTPPAWYAHQLPDVFLRAACAITLFIELILPFAIWLPRRLRQLACVGLSCFQLTIFFTGNYSFFNLLTLALCVLLLDDQALQAVRLRCLPRRWRPASVPDSDHSFVSARWWWHTGLGAAVAAALLVTSASLFQLALSPQAASGWQRSWLSAVAPWHLASNYGVFAVMTRERMKIVLEASDDGEQWQAYPFRFKPGALDRAPPWIAPLQPRLDWQLWFAALADYPPPWFEQFML